MFVLLQNAAWICTSSVHSNYDNFMCPFSYTWYMFWPNECSQFTYILPFHYFEWNQCIFICLIAICTVLIFSQTLYSYIFWNILYFKEICYNETCKYFSKFIVYSFMFSVMIFAMWRCIFVFGFSFLNEFWILCHRKAFSTLRL